MKSLLEFVVCSIVNNPTDVSIEERQEGDLINFTIHTHPDDIKIVIGKNGRTIKSIRELAKVKAIKEKKKINVRIEE